VCVCVRVCVDSRWPCGSEEPVYTALKADKENFNQVLISPTMVNDHMPDKVLEALEKVRVCQCSILSIFSYTQNVFCLTENS